ncbi:chemotaxis protein CheW [Gemmatimonas sp.]|uniref:chemotaxis protein CheW n=1 Tax=Gemmatimonas sp. TaxID=1962908 RepID=UPI0035648EC5
MKSFPDTSQTITTTPSISGDDGDEQRPRVLVVASDRDTFGIPVEQVREVIRSASLRRVPGSPPVLRGIVNVRGAIVTVLDLQALLTGARAVTAGSVVLLEYGSRLIGLAVHAAHDVRVLEALLESPHERESAVDRIVPLDAVALCARHLHSADERER